MSDQIHVFNILMAFASALLIIYLTAKCIGEEKKARWFKKREKAANSLTRRGYLGATWQFGVPRSWQGLLVAVCMYVLIFSVGYLLIFIL
ncbi:putative membrane protein [Propionispora sp. 2/2-37]|uniref:hypothetical protein n=1 Tax=Propionispora sp. 2/2-37 TaxID=1677858 RepID=UPI0006BB57E4|nr:hypothetical protein [Propionispora sp. 2/2-37]CUH97311.1 putative membrane protein [Propionispora sp. 2/2-37]